MKKLPMLLGMVLALPFVSCSSDDEVSEIGKGAKAEMGVVFHTLTGNDPMATKASQLKQAEPGDFSFSSGYIAIEKLEYEVESETDPIEVEFDLEQNTVIDFATGTTTPSIDNVLIPAGTFNEFEIEIELDDDYEGPPVLINGTYTAPDGSTLPVRFEYDSDDTFEVEREGTVVFEENQTAITEITIDPRTWFAEVSDADMAGAVADAEGIIVISESENTQIYEIASNGLKLSTDIDLDDDDDNDDDDDDDDDDN